MSKDKKSKKINLKHMLKNNGYMLGLIMKACPGYVILSMILSVTNAAKYFLLSTYLYKYALNALQEGKELKTVLITLGLMGAFSLFFDVFFCFINKYYHPLTYPVVESYIQDLIQKKAAQVDLACFESSSFYDTYVKATDEAADRAYTVLNNVSDIVWLTVNLVATVTLILTIDPIFIVLAFLPLVFTILLGKKRNRIKYERSMRNKEAARQRAYVRRTFYLSDFSKEMRLTEMWKVMSKRMHSSIAEMKDIVKEYGYKIMFFRYLFDFVFDILVYMGTIILAAFKTLVLKNMLLGDCFVVISSITSVAYNINYAGDVVLKLDENSLYIDNLRSFLEYEVHIAEDENAPTVPAFKKLELKKMLI